MEQPEPIRPVFGLETEYGIAVATEPGSPPPTEEEQARLHPTRLSNHVVLGYGSTEHVSGGWDYRTESPLLDARGFRLPREQAHPDQLTDLVDDTMANLVLTNGARLYVDHAHPEYSGPEVTTAADAVRFDRAGDEVMLRAAAEASARLGRTVRLYKNNTDGKGASYGTHENYLMSRATPFEAIVAGFTPFLVSRQVFTGAGRVGIGQRGEQPGYQLTQRADFFEAEVGLETTMRRPIINTRDEPHARASQHRRLHVITGDANQSEFATWLKVGTAALVLQAIEAGTVRPVQLRSPVAAMRRVSHDLDLGAPLEVSGGGTITALELQGEYLTAVEKFLADRAGHLTDAQRAEGAELVSAWGGVLTDLATDPGRLSDRLDWVAKLALLRRYADRDGLGWDAPKLALVDLQYGELDPARSLHHALVRRGRMRRLTTDEQVEGARHTPPADTRAWLRGTCMSRYGDHVVSASWDSIVVDVPTRKTLTRLRTLDPLASTRDELGTVVEQSPGMAALLIALGV